MRLVRPLLAIVPFVGFLFPATTAQADVLASFTHSDGGGFRILSQQIQISIGYGPNTWIGVFDDGHPLTTASVGTTITESSNANDPDWNSFCSLMTDGISEELWFRLGFYNSSSAAGGNVEPAVLFGNSADPRVDLHGYIIDSASLKLLSLSVVSPGSNPNHDGIWTDLSCSYTVTINGHAAPEPSSLVVFAAGTCLLLRRRPSSQ